MKRNKPLPNYLATRRKNLDLSQQEVAQVLGWRDGETVSRYERNKRLPSLKVALACQVLFHVPVHELFAGIFKEVSKVTKERARQLADKLSEQS